MPEHSCPLRGLTLCDGHEVVSLAPRGDDVPCYCRLLESPSGPQNHEDRYLLVWSRARSVARAHELVETREARRRWEDRRRASDQF